MHRCCFVWMSKKKKKEKKKEKGRGIFYFPPSALTADSRSFCFICCDQRPLPVMIRSPLKIWPQWITVLSSLAGGSPQSKFVTVFRFQWTFNYALWKSHVSSHRTVYQTGKHQSSPARVLKGCKQTKGRKMSRIHLHMFIFLTFFFFFSPYHENNSSGP